jgi:hypothetical protein|tara:strand:+ start:651 stop:815 length:165 start_codon:yes stop_codon:yes gene_type:complete
MNKLNFYFCLVLMLTSFGLAFMGVIIMFSTDVMLGTILAIAGIGMALKIVHSAE